MSVAHRLLGWLDRHFAFRSPAQVRASVLALVALGAAVALWLGQDSNWDLRNYHLYNGYAWWHGRLGTDLAPAQMQSYFGPLLDIFQYPLLALAPAPLAALLLGMLHGLAFALVAAIAWEALAGHRQRARWAPLLGLFGLGGAAFLSEFATSMGDVSSALPVLAALALLLRAQRLGRIDAAVSRLWLAAGALLGLAVALKLTNGVYALALAAAALAGGCGWRRRVLDTALLTGAAVLVFLVLAGHGYWKVWQLYGNPLFPQFNGWFKGELALPVSVADTRWLPTALWQHAIWPLLFTLDPWRTSEVALVQLQWAVLYVLMLAALLAGAVRRGGARVRWPLPWPLVVFVLVAYLVWQGVFSIQRYLVALELLVPLLAWGLWQFLLPRWGGRPLALFLAGCAGVGLVGRGDWGHEPWAWQGFRVPPPTMPAPERSLVLLLGNEPQSWRVPFLPEQAVYASVVSNFPESPAYAAQVRTLASQRPQVYLIVPAAAERRSRRIAMINRWAGWLGLDRQADCSALRWGLAHGLKARLDAQAGRCRLLPLVEASMAAAETDRAVLAAAAQALPHYGLRLEPDDCERRSSWIGATDYPYQWCRLRPSAPGAG